MSTQDFRRLIDIIESIESSTLTEVMLSEDEEFLSELDWKKLAASGAAAAALAGGGLAASGDANAQYAPQAQTQQAEQTVYRVLYAAFNDQQSAQQYANDLKSKNLFSKIDKNANGVYRVLSQNLAQVSDAQSLAQIAKSAGVADPRIIKSQVPQAPQAQVPQAPKAQQSQGSSVQANLQNYNNLLTLAHAQAMIEQAIMIRGSQGISSGADIEELKKYRSAIMKSLIAANHDQKTKDFWSDEFNKQMKINYNTYVVPALKQRTQTQSMDGIYNAQQVIDRQVGGFLPKVQNILQM